MSEGIASINQTSELTTSIHSLQMNKEEAKEALQELFGQTYFNGGQDSIDDIEEEIKELEKQISNWEATLKELEDNVRGIEGNIKDKSTQLTNVISNLNDETRKFEKDQKAYIDMAITDAVNRTKSKNRPGQINTTFEHEFRLAIVGMPVGSTVIDALYDEQGVLNGTVETLFTKLDGYANESKAIMNQVSNTKATISLLTQTKNAMSLKVDTLYKNTNNDAKVPVYSYEKEAYVSELAKNYGVTLSDDKAGVGNELGGGRNEAEITRLAGLIGGYAGDVTGSSDKVRYSYGQGTTAIKGLETVLFGEGNTNATTVQEGSLVWQMAQAGASNEEIMDTLVATFGNIGLSKNGNSYGIPNGYGDGRWGGGRAGQIYTAVNSIANNSAGLPEAQPAAAGDASVIANAMDAVDKLASKGFTFKEAMYALGKLFPGLEGMSYSLAEQAGTKEGVVKFSADTNYTPLVEKIKAHTNAGGKWENSQVIQNTPAPRNEGALQVSRKDPISVHDGNSSYYFMADNGNGQYDGIEDMLGYQNGMNDFELKYGNLITTNGAGQRVITGDALNNVMVMKLEEIDNGDGSVGVKQSFMSAADAGMTEINLSSAVEDGSIDINNAKIEHRFNITLNGKTKAAEQAVEDEIYINTVINNDKLTGEKMFTQLTDAEITKAFYDADSDLFANSSAAYLSDVLSDLKGYKESLLNYAENGLTFTEEEFRDMIARNKEEADYILEVAKMEGNNIFNDIQSDFTRKNDPTGQHYMNTKGEALNEVIQDRVTEKIRETYETYGMTDDEYQEYMQQKNGETQDAE